MIFLLHSLVSIAHTNLDKRIEESNMKNQQNTKTVRENEIFSLYRNPTTYEVEIKSDITLEDYQELTHKDDWDTLLTYAKANGGKTVTFINPTMEGGGVAMLRPPLVHILRMLGVDAHWFVMSSGAEQDINPFLFTKLMHNIIQRRGSEDARINEEGKKLHQKWNAHNAEVLTRQPEITGADVIVIDDPQPAPLKKYIDEVNPDAQIVWRNHIDNDGLLMADPSSPQGEVAEYIFKECGIGDVDAMINHPVETFVHPDYFSKTYFAPATIEPFDDLNRELNDAEISNGIDFINAQIDLKNQEFKEQNRESDIQSHIDPMRRRIALVARFDESKGMDKALMIGVRTREIMEERGISRDELPQVILVGNGSIDDPSGVPMFEEMLQLRREQYADHKDDIIIMRLKHNYIAMNALMYPFEKEDNYDGTQLIAMQTSDAEGCETRITDWIRHGVPVVISNRGGMQLQVIEGESGHVLDYDHDLHDTERGAELIAELMLNHEQYETMRKSTLLAAEKFNNREFTTISNIIRMLRIFTRIQEGKPADKHWKLSEITEETIARKS